MAEQRPRPRALAQVAHRLLAHDELPAPPANDRGEGVRLTASDVEPFLGEAGDVPPWDFTDAIDAGQTAKALDLASDPAFADKAPSLQDTAKGWLTGSLQKDAETDDPTAAAQPASLAKETQRSDRVTARLRNMVALRRIGRSTIIEVSAR